MILNETLIYIEDAKYSLKTRRFWLKTKYLFCENLKPVCRIMTPLKIVRMFVCKLLQCNMSKRDDILMQLQKFLNIKLTTANPLNQAKNMIIVPATSNTPLKYNPAI